MGLKSIGGEIVEVEGGHILRATGRKDRHSKVFTAKGPRDRRVRLAAHTAIQFYDVQDRLGYDRPSKAVDWLLTKAKDSIDKLAELPPWDPIVGSIDNLALGVSEQISPFHADGIKSFFPTNNNNFPNYPQGSGSRQNHQDLCLSLHTLKDPGGVTAASGSAHHSGHGFDGGWAPQQDVGRFTRLMGWAGDSGGGGEGRGGIMFNNNNNNSSPLFLSTMANYGNNQRGALQSNYSSMTRDFEDNHNHNHNYNHGQNHQVISGMGHGSDSFMGFYIPSQIHGDLHAGAAASMSNRASTSSLPSDSTPH